jgi:hypothetical protein
MRDVLGYVSNPLLKEQRYNKSLDICSPDILTYKQIMLQFTSVRKFEKYIIYVPIMTPYIKEQLLD